MVEAARQQPVIGETWTMQSCLKHGCPTSFPYNWREFPVAAVSEIVKIEPWYQELIDCGCMEAGRVSPRLHDPAKKGDTDAQLPR